MHGRRFRLYIGMVIINTGDNSDDDDDDYYNDNHHENGQVTITWTTFKLGPP